MIVAVTVRHRQPVMVDMARPVGGEGKDRRGAEPHVARHAGVDEQRKALAVRVESLQTRLYAQYNAMDSLVGRLQKTSESLANQLASLPGFVKKD